MYIYIYVYIITPPLRHPSVAPGPPISAPPLRRNAPTSEVPRSARRGRKWPWERRRLIRMIRMSFTEVCACVCRSVFDSLMFMMELMFYDL